MHTYVVKIGYVIKVVQTLGLIFPIRPSGLFLLLVVNMAVMCLII